MNRRLEPHRDRPVLETPCDSGVRTTIAFTACVLTDSHGVDGKDAAASVAGVLNAQTTTNLRAQSLTGRWQRPDADAVIAVNTLAQRSCNLIITAGNPQVTAVWKQPACTPTNTSSSSTRPRTMPAVTSPSSQARTRAPYH